jgi:DNA-binding transcriptional MocR family regulator
MLFIFPQKKNKSSNKHSPNFRYLNGHSYICSMSKDFLYNEIANGIAGQINNGVLKPGDRLPSVRMLCEEHQISMNTAKRVFLELEAQSLIDAKPQSGYFVSRRPYPRLPLPEVSRPASFANSHEPNELIRKVYGNMGNDALTLFSVGAPSGDLLPLAKLKKEVIQATRELSEGGANYESLQGNLKLRSMIAIRSLAWGGNLHENDLITTNGSVNALSFCLMALGKPGDTIAIESPGYPGLLQLAFSLGLKVLELPTHPVTGIEIDALKKVIPHIHLCLLVPNFNTPLGSCMPEANKKEIVALLAKHHIPLIEDDIYGDLYFGTQRPKCCKSFDTEGNVLWCSSVSKTLAPGYRVGWVAPGKYKDKLLKVKLIHSLSSSAITQEAVANFLKTGKYENHLRQLRRTLQDNYQHFSHAIADYFPPGTKTSRPQGGVSIWVEFPKEIDTAQLYELAIKQRISIAPGRMFTLQNQFENCMRLCIGLPWSNDIKLKLKQLGNMAKMMLA